MDLRAIRGGQAIDKRFKGDGVVGLPAREQRGGGVAHGTRAAHAAIGCGVEQGSEHLARTGQVKLPVNLHRGQCLVRIDALVAATRAVRRLLRVQSQRAQALLDGVSVRQRQQQDATLTSAQAGGDEVAGSISRIVVVAEMNGVRTGRVGRAG